jgi:lipopolysaccharide transport system permease protein
MPVKSPGYPGRVQAPESQALAAATAPSGNVHRIQPSPWLVPVDFRELWRQRALMGFFVLRDIKSRYRQTYLGPVWGIVRPLMTIVVFSAIFGGLAGISPDKSFHGPYALWVTPGVIAFSYVSVALNTTSTSLVSNTHLITKVYFPRLYVPMSTAVTPIVDFLLGLLVVLGLFIYFGQVPSWHIVFLPAFLALSALVTVGLGIWLSAFTARYRDWVFAVPFLVQIWQYATPVIYPLYRVPHRDHLRLLVELNPFTAVVSGFRWSLLGTPFGSLWMLAASLGIGTVATLSGLYAFRRAERFMVDAL